MSTPPEKNQPPVIEFRDVAKVFNPGTPREYKALEHLGFCIEDLPGKGEFITILGPSGCGKSTALNLLAGFQEVWPPTAGEILVRGQPVTAPGVDRGMVFQKYSSFPHLTVRQNVRFGMELNRRREGLGEDEIESRAMDWIGKVGLAPHADKYPHQLSGGQQQRVALARTLVCRPKIILMDEPFSALDEPTRLEMQSLVVELWQQVEATVLLVTHSIIEAVYLGDRVWIFSQAPGRIAREITQTPAAVPGEPPNVLQQKPAFLEAVERVSAIFLKIEQGEAES
ncbi:MAG TPA: ABC transporter ATP-binding protein [Acidobacteriota bacterium]|nr:ABC transporter ATP-binding protein [Acidobacteriota bacterium]HNR38873.1 ABC transporter ATP-binding protein [Acidobacteriota bacterium]HNU00161.1 ABC transporter ATP-binding protein [Acidobacteriota bacterium]HPB28922.1 ABC transporter ATP-binding protein [Acidobacteriota bacterium]HQO26586.1 ABC transporter ATP-binding protein [Acidobacteriota bacterium]